MVKADGLLVVLDVDFTKSLVDILIELLHRNDKLQRLTALGKASEPEVLESCLLETEEVVYEPPPASEQTVQKKDTFKFQLGLQNLRVAIVEDAMKSNPTALLLRVCARTCTCMHICIHTHAAHTRTYTNTHTHTYTCSMIFTSNNFCRLKRLPIWPLTLPRTAYRPPSSCPTLACLLAPFWKWTMQ